MDKDSRNDDLVQIKDICFTRAKSYRVLASYFYEQPTLEQLQQMQKACQAISIAELDNEEMQAGYNMIGRYLLGSLTEKRQRVAVDFAHSILAAGVYEKRVATPYESVFTSETGLLMQEERDNVVQMMAQEGLVVDDSLQTPEDHLSFELEFMAYLAENMAASLEDDLSEATRLLQVQQSFMAKHLTNWIVEYTETLEEVALTPFYQGIALLLRGFITWDRTIMEELVAELDKMQA